MRKVGIFGGSFNPIHTGHIALAQAVQKQCGLDEVWLMVSPQNPLKRNDSDLLDDSLRFEMAQNSQGVIKDLPKNYCIDCGKEITAAAIRCSECAKIASRSIERPSKEELYQFLTEHKGNFSAAGREYGTNDNNVRKWCKSYGMPTHSSDYKCP